MVAVDVAVVGGGIQGLTVLRELTAAGYGCVLITDADVGSGQTLHSHGLLNSGTGLMTGVLADELHGLTLPYLRRLGVAVYGDDRSFLLAPDALVEQLAPVWAANRYQPERVDPSALPPGIEAPAPVYRVRGFNVEKRRLVAALVDGLEPLVLRGEVVDADGAVRVRAHPSDEVVSVEARAVVVAAGCGTKRLLGDVFAVDRSVLSGIGYGKMHMVCLRAPVGVLPDVGTIASPEVIVVAHPSPDRRLVTWYVTPVDPASPRHVDAPDDGVAEIEPSVVAVGIDRLVRLVPGLAGRQEPIQATVFAGYKQDFDGQPTRRVCAVVDAERNVVMALPSVLANAVPNAADVLALVRQRTEPTATSPAVHWDSRVAVGPLNEETGQTQWRDWNDFVQAYDR